MFFVDGFQLAFRRVKGVPDGDVKIFVCMVVMLFLVDANFFEGSMYFESD